MTAAASTVPQSPGSSAPAGDPPGGGTVRSPGTATAEGAGGGPESSRAVSEVSETPAAPVELEPRELGPDELRQALGRFVTGVTIVTCRDEDGNAVGLTANSFNALSLDPPLVLWSLRAASSSIDAFTTASHFAVNVLSAAQVDLSRRFARPSSAKFDEGEWTDGQGGAPLLAGCVAVFECRRRSHHAAGDHVLFIGEVERIGGTADTPLVYHAGHYRTLSE